jgi:hypothetical protein
MFDLRKYQAECLVSDSEWQMIFESGTVIQTGNNLYHVVFKNRVITFNIKNNNPTILNIRRTPNSNYQLPLLSKTACFKQRAAVYLELEKLRSSKDLDDGNFLIYAAI